MCRGYFYSQEIDPHHATEHRSTDQSRNGCRVCHFFHAQLFEITHAGNIKSPLEQPSCQNAKVVQAFCDAGCRLSTPCLVSQPPVDALRVPDEMPTALNSHIASRWRHAFLRGRRQHAILIAPAALSVPSTPRLRALVHFGRRPTPVSYTHLTLPTKRIV